MILMMGKMYPNKKMNAGIIITSIAVFILTLAALRTQTPINDVQYMKAMIPHHSSAILTSKNANIKDPEVNDKVGYFGKNPGVPVIVPAGRLSRTTSVPSRTTGLFSRLAGSVTSSSAHTNAS